MTTFDNCAATLENLRSVALAIDEDTKSRLRVWKHSSDALLHPIETIKLKRLHDRLTDMCTELTTLYVAGAMPQEAAAEFEQLLASEPILREMAGPILAAWQLAEEKPGPTDSEVDDAYAKFRAMIGRSR
jgi:hypothetical protein